MAKSKTVYVCQNCGTDSPKWIGKCPSCGEWNSYVEEIIHKAPSSSKVVIAGLEPTRQKPILISDVQTSVEDEKIKWRIEKSSKLLIDVIVLM